MICTNCGSQVSDGAQFCDSCGTRVAVATVPAESAGSAEEDPPPGDHEELLLPASRLLLAGQALAIVGGLAALILFFMPWMTVKDGTGFQIVRDVVKNTEYFRDSSRFYLEFIFLALGPVLGLAAAAMALRNVVVRGRLLPFLQLLAGIIGLAPLLVFADLGVGLTGPPMAPLTYEFGGSMLAHLAVAVGSGLELTQRD